MWKKGAVVIVKHGDEAMADAMASPFEQNDISNDDQNYDKAWKDLLSEAKKDEIDLLIADAEIRYGHNWQPPAWAKHIVEGFAFVVYKICVFIDKYLVIREEKNHE